MDKNLIPLDDLNDIIKKKKLKVLSYGYSKRKNKKYYVVNTDSNVIHFGALNYEDYLIHKDPIRQEKFKKRFKSLYEKNKDNINSSIYWSWNLLW